MKGLSRTQVRVALLVGLVAFALVTTLWIDSGGETDLTVGSPPSGVGGGGWASLAESPVAARLDPAIAWTGNQLVVYGGVSLGPPEKREQLRDGGIFDPSTGVWSELPPAPSPHPVALPKAGWDGQQLVVVGVPCGNDADEVEMCEPGGLEAFGYVPSNKSWSRIALPPAVSSDAHLWWYDVAGSTDAGTLFKLEGKQYLRDPERGTWRRKPEPPFEPRTLCAMPNGPVAVSFTDDETYDTQLNREEQKAAADGKRFHVPEDAARRKPGPYKAATLRPSGRWSTSDSPQVFQDLPNVLEATCGVDELFIVPRGQAARATQGSWFDGAAWHEMSAPPVPPDVSGPSAATEEALVIFNGSLHSVEENLIFHPSSNRWERRPRSGGLPNQAISAGNRVITHTIVDPDNGIARFDSIEPGP